MRLAGLLDAPDYFPGVGVIARKTKCTSYQISIFLTIYVSIAYYFIPNTLSAGDYLQLTRNSWVITAVVKVVIREDWYPGPNL